MADRLELADMIKTLRAELARAQAEGVGEAIRFLVEDVELELEIAAETQAEGGIAAKFYVITSQIKGSKKDLVTQKMKLRLKAQQEAVDPSTGERTTGPAEISGTVQD